MIKPLTFEDPEGVKYFISAGGTVYIELPSDKSKKNPYRKIGKFDFYTKTFIKKDNYKDGTFRKLQAFGFPYHLLKKLHTEYDLQIVKVEISDIEIYSIEASKLFETGYFVKQYRNYKNKGLELRLFVPIKHFTKEQIITIRR